MTAQRTDGNGWMNTGYTFTDISLRNIQLYTVNYYDDYNYQELFTQYASDINFTHRENYDDKYVFTGFPQYSAKGQLTGTRVWMMDDSNREILTALYYDAKNRPVQRKEISTDKKKIKEYYAYDFAGNIIRKYNLQGHPQYQGTSTEYTYTYDNAGRLKKVAHKVNGSREEKILSEITYDELGRIKSRSLLDGVETQDFSYNIHIR